MWTRHVYVKYNQNRNRFSVKLSLFSRTETSVSSSRETLYFFYFLEKLWSTRKKSHFILSLSMRLLTMKRESLFTWEKRWCWRFQRCSCRKTEGWEEKWYETQHNYLQSDDFSRMSLKWFELVTQVYAMYWFVAIWQLIPHLSAAKTRAIVFWMKRYLLRPAKCSLDMNMYKTV